MGDALVLDEAVLASGLTGLLVQTHGIGVSSFKTRDLRRHQSVLVAERGWIVIGPLAQLFEVGRQEASPLSLLVDRRFLIACRNRQRGVVEVVEQHGLANRGPQQRLSLTGCREGPRVVP